MPFLPLVVFSILIASGSCAKSKRTGAVELNVYEFSNCPNTENLKISFDNISMSLDPETKMLFVSGVMDMEIIWDEDVHITMSLKKCQNRDINSCIVVFDAPVTHICEHMAEKEKPWSSFVEHLDHFKPICPIKEGQYAIEEAPIDMSSMRDMENAIGVWHLQSKATKHGETVLCSDSAVEIKRARRKKPNKDEELQPEVL